MKKPEYNLKQFKNPRDKRLASEHLRLFELCQKTPRISFRFEPNGNRPPEEYTIIYLLKSIVAIDNQQKPVYDYEHELEIKFPAGYPNTASAMCTMRTPVWHPNVKWDGRFQGRVCVNAKGFGNLYFIDDLVLRVGLILQYQNYHAKNEQPFPEDEKVARWVRDFAEPQGILNKENGEYVDGSSLLGPIPDWNKNDSSGNDEDENPDEYGDDGSGPPPPKPPDPIITTPSGLKITGRRTQSPPEKQRKSISISRKK